MALFDDASLVVTPNGYKAGTLYSIKPTSGLGDMTVVRATTATRVNSAGLIESVANNVPRLDYSNGTCPSLLVEPQRTNLVLQSEDITNAAWITNASPTRTANTTIAPNGTLTADTIASTGGSSGVYQVFTVASGVEHSFSVYIKNITTATNLQIGCDLGPINGFVSFNAVTGLITSTGAGITGSSVTDEGNGWYRVSGTYNSTGTTNTFIIFGQASMTFAVWGCQFEVGSYPTSYIPTTSATVTRNADAISKTGISSLIGQTEGTAFVELNFTHSTTGGNGYLMQLYYDSANRVILYRDGASGCLAYYFLQGGTVFNYTSSISSNARHKLAFAYKSGDSVFYIDGAQVDTDATTFSAFSSLAELHIGANFNPTQAELGDYNYNQAIVFKTRLTNAELASLTTL